MSTVDTGFSTLVSQQGMTLIQAIFENPYLLFSAIGHLSMVLAISPGQLMASLLKNRFEWWDKAAPLSAADHEAQATLKDFERQHEEQ